MNVPLADLKAQYQSIQSEITEAISEVIEEYGLHQRASRLTVRAGVCRLPGRCPRGRVWQRHRLAGNTAAGDGHWTG